MNCMFASEPGMIVLRLLLPSAVVRRWRELKPETIQARKETANSRRICASALHRPRPPSYGSHS